LQMQMYIQWEYFNYITDLILFAGTDCQSRKAD
jgi:hypothetical protein